MLTVRAGTVRARCFSETQDTVNVHPSQCTCSQRKASMLLPRTPQTNLKQTKVHTLTLVTVSECKANGTRNDVRW